LRPHHTAEPVPANQGGPSTPVPAALEHLLRATSLEAAADVVLDGLGGRGRYVIQTLRSDDPPPDAESARHDRLLHAGVGGRIVLRRIDGSPLPAFSPSQEHWLELGSQRLAELLAMRSLLDSVSGLEHAERLQRALFAIADMAGSERDMSSMLRDLHRIIGELMYAENFYIALYDERRDALQFLYFADTVDTTEYSPELEIPMASIAGGLTWYLIRDSRPLMGSTAQLRQQVSGELRIHGADSLDWLGVPMVRNGEAVGVLVVQSYIEANRYTETDRAVLAFVADHVLTAVERKRTQQELEHRVADRTRELAEANVDLQRQIAERERSEHLQAVLYRIAALSTSEEDADHFYRHIHRAVAEVVVADNFYIALISEDGTQLEFPYYVDAIGGTRPARPLGRGLTEYAMRLGKPVLVGPVEAERLAASGEIQAAVALAGTPASSWLGVPLTINGNVIGLVAVQSYRADQPYDAGDAEVLTFVAHQIARSLERRKHAQSLRRWNAELEERVESRTRELIEQIAVREKIEAELKHQVMHDSLTGLPNRLYLRDRLERAIADRKRHAGRRFALLYLDVDRFKLFNDSLGHLAGDEVLREVARRLKTCVREPDVVARLSGDEFAIFLEHAPIPQTACKIAQRIAASLVPPMSIAGKELQASASIGIAVCDDRHNSPDDLFHDADVALYRAKSAGRQRFVLFDDNLHRTAMDVLEVEHQLRAALQREEFVPFFQPLVRLADAAVIGYEALIRWQHPIRGLLAPGAFLPVAEESGLIEPIDWELYRLALQEARGLLRPGQYFTLNTSPRHFQSEDFDARLLQLAREQDFPPAQLRIEVTEGTLLSDPDAAVGILGRLRAAGVEAALDDFGTGYSSLGYVNRFALRMIKIDRSFVTPLGGEDAQRSSAIISAILALAQSLSMDVIAEGVETQAQRQALLDMGCVYAQGYLFGRPARASEL
jgi:diguanylate cyclase (GGDEF)-like protein